MELVGLLCSWDSPGKNTGVGCHSRGSSDPRTEPVSLMLPALAEGFFTTSVTWETLNNTITNILKCISVFLEDFFLEVTLLAQAFKTVGNAY